MGLVGRMRATGGVSTPNAPLGNHERAHLQMHLRVLRFPEAQMRMHVQMHRCASALSDTEDFMRFRLTMLCFLTAVSVQTAVAGFQVIAVDTIAGGTGNFALDINASGAVTGNSRTTASSLPLNAYSWGGPGPAQNIGVLPGSNSFSRGYAINNAGVIVGESDNNNSRAFRWDAVNGMTELLSIAGTSGGVAHDINNAGVIVGISSNGQASRPTRWTNGVASDLGSIDGQANTFGRAWGINDAGDAVGFSRRQSTPSSIAQATLWRDSSVVNLGSLQPDSFSEAFAISDIDVAVGAAVSGTTRSGTPIRRAVRWDLSGPTPTITDLGSLGRTFAEAKDVNDAGQIVGFVTNISGLSDRAFLWENGVMTDLNDLLPANSGWVLRSAEGINEQGWITGFGTFNGATRAFVLVPEPVSLALLAVGALALRRR